MKCTQITQESINSSHMTLSDEDIWLKNVEFETNQIPVIILAIKFEDCWGYQWFFASLLLEKSMRNVI